MNSPNIVIMLHNHINEDEKDLKLRNFLNFDHQSNKMYPDQVRFERVRFLILVLPGIDSLTA